MRDATAACPTTRSSRRSRTHDSSLPPSATTGRYSAAASSHGTCATATWPTRSTRSRHTFVATAAPRASSCGPTTLTSATHAPPNWTPPASSTSGNWLANAIPGRSRWSARRPTPGRSRRPPTGTVQWNANRCVRPCPAATRTCCTSCLTSDAGSTWPTTPPVARCRVRASSGRSASSTARRPNASAATFAATSPSSSTCWCTSIRPARWSHSTGHQGGRRAKRPTPTLGDLTKSQA